MTRNELWWKQQEVKERIEKQKRNLKRLFEEMDKYFDDPFLKERDYLSSVAARCDALKILLEREVRLNSIELDLEEFENGSINKEEYERRVQEDLTEDLYAPC